MISVESGLPRANTICHIIVADYLSENLNKKLWKFVDSSTGFYWWESLDGHTILQSDEVTYWFFAAGSDSSVGRAED